MRTEAALAVGAEGLRIWMDAEGAVDAVAQVEIGGHCRGLDDLALRHAGAPQPIDVGGLDGGRGFRDLQGVIGQCALAFAELRPPVIDLDRADPQRVAGDLAELGGVAPHAGLASILNADHEGDQFTFLAGEASLERHRQRTAEGILGFEHGGMLSQYVLHVANVAEVLPRAIEQIFVRLDVRWRRQPEPRNGVLRVDGLPGLGPDGSWTELRSSSAPRISVFTPRRFSRASTLPVSRAV